MRYLLLLLGVLGATMGFDSAAETLSMCPRGRGRL